MQPDAQEDARGVLVTLLPFPLLVRILDWMRWQSIFSRGRTDRILAGTTQHFFVIPFAVLCRKPPQNDEPRILGITVVSPVFFLVGWDSSVTNWLPYPPVLMKASRRRSGDNAG